MRTMINNICFILSIISVLLLPDYVSGQGNEYLSEGQLFVIYSNKLDAMKLSTINMQNIKLTEFNVLDYKDDERIKSKVARVSCNLGGFEMRIDTKSGIVRGCHNYFIDEITGGPNPVLYEGGSKPLKSTSDIMQQAEKYLNVLVDKMPDMIYPGQANYEVQSWYDAKRSYKGKWKIFWKRKEGLYEYHDDNIIMFIDEDYGLAGYGYNIYSQYDPPKQINVTKDKALEISKNNIDTIITSSSSRGWFDMYKAGNIKSAGLKIVNPNYFHDSARYKIVPSSYARLAWVVVFECIGKKLIEVKGQLGELEPIKAQIWIDAETGEILGGG